MKRKFSNEEVRDDNEDNLQIYLEAQLYFYNHHHVQERLCKIIDSGSTENLVSNKNDGKAEPKGREKKKHYTNWRECIIVVNLLSGNNA